MLGVYLSNRAHLDNLSVLRSPTLNLMPILVRSPAGTDLLDSAKQVHEDLQAISTAERSAVALWEIRKWTGVGVDCFVNFLKLPETSEGTVVDGAVELEEITDESLQERAEVFASKSEEMFEMPEELAKLPEMDAYQVCPLESPAHVSMITDFSQHSVDLEVTVTDGRMNMGIFCAEAMLGLREAQGVLEDVRKALEELMAADKN
jgi:hypothetical protein